MVMKLHIFITKKFLRWTFNLICLAVISLDSAFNKDGNYDQQVFLKECKYIKKVMIQHVTEEIEIFSDDSTEFDEE